MVKVAEYVFTCVGAKMNRMKVRSLPASSSFCGPSMVNSLSPVSCTDEMTSFSRPPFQRMSDSCGLVPMKVPLPNS